MLLIKYSFLLLFIFSCGSREDGTVAIKTVQGVNASFLQGGVVILGTDGIEKVSRTFNTGEDFVNSQFVVPGDREWEFKVFSWEGDASTKNKIMKGKIRCGFVRGFVNGGETLEIPIDLTNSACFEHLFPVSSPAGDMVYDTVGGDKVFKPIRLFGCAESDFDILGGQLFSGSDCYTNPSFGVSRSYRVIIEGKGQGQPGIGSSGLFSTCIDQDTTTGGNNLGATLADLNLPIGYAVHPDNIFIPLDLPILLESFSDPGCTTTSKYKVIRLENGVADYGLQFVEPGFTLLTSVTEAHTNYVNFAFHDKLPATSSSEFIQVFEPPFVNTQTLTGACAPDGSIVSFIDNASVDPSVSTTCSGGVFSLTSGAGWTSGSGFDFRFELDAGTGGGPLVSPFPFHYDTINPGAGGVINQNCSATMSLDITTITNMSAGNAAPPNGLPIPPDQFIVDIDDGGTLVYGAVFDHDGNDPQTLDFMGNAVPGSVWGTFPSGTVTIKVTPVDPFGNIGTTISGGVTCP